MAAIGKRLVKVEVDSVEYSAELVNARMAAADSDSDTVTFSDAASGGGKDWKFAFSAVQDAASESLWSLIFDSAGTTVPITYMPYGNATPSVDEPHYTANAVIAQFDGDFLGGDADPSTSAKFTFESEWSLEAKPVKVTA